VNAALLLRVLEDALAPAVAAAGGRLDVAADPTHVVELLTAGTPTGFRAILAYAGESAAKDIDAPGIRQIEVTFTIQAARGLALKPGRDAHRATASGRDSLLDLAAQGDRWFAGFTGTTYGDVDSRFHFVSRTWLEIEGQTIRQLLTTYSLRIGADAPAPADRLTLTFPAP
jgi:hypothetical protein